MLCSRIAHDVNDAIAVRMNLPIPQRFGPHINVLMSYEDHVHVVLLQ